MSINKNISVLRKVQGVSMIEVLIALVILSIGLLATAAMQMKALQSTSNSEYRTQAINLVMDMADKMQARYSEVLKDAATTPYDAATDRCGGDADCTTARNEYLAWVNAVQVGIDVNGDGDVESADGDILPLPGGNAMVCRDSDHDLFSNELDSDNSGTINNADNPCNPAAANVCDVAGTANDFSPYVIRVCWTESGGRRDVDGDGDIDANDRDANQIIDASGRILLQFSATIQ